MAEPQLTPKQIRALRRTLGESSAVFGARFGRTPRAVQSWEIGARVPDVLAQRLLLALWQMLPEKANKIAS